MTNRERDDAMDRLLRRGLAREADAQPSSACVDAETLAAWIDGSLPRDESARAEAHAAACGRCQALLASMARIAPAPSTRPWWRAATMRWMAPVAAVATALVVWVAVDRDRSAPDVSGAKTAATSAAREGAVRPGTPPPDAAPTEPFPAVMTPDRPQQFDAQRPDARNLRAPKGAALPAPAAKPSPREDRSEASAKALADTRAVDSIEAPARNLPAAGRSAGQAGRGTFPETPAPAPPPPAPANPAAAAASPRAADAPQALQESVQILARQREAATESASRVVDIPSPEPAFRWRVVGSSSIERSTDGGATWSAQSIAAAPVAPLLAARETASVPLALSAGSAPARDICWIVGRSGTVFLSTDGTTWRRRAFPEPLNLIAVRATDARSAVVTTEDGRQFSTSDGGTTWSKVP